MYLYNSIYIYTYLLFLIAARAFGVSEGPDSGFGLISKLLLCRGCRAWSTGFEVVRLPLRVWKPLTALKPKPKCKRSA